MKRNMVAIDKLFIIYQLCQHRQSNQVIAFYKKLLIKRSREEHWNDRDRISHRQKEGEVLTSSNDSGEPGGKDNGEYAHGQIIGLFLGPLLYVILLVMKTPADVLESQRALASTVWIACW